MKVYFDYSARGLKQFEKNYQQIYRLIKKLGHTHLNDLTINEKSSTYRKKFYEGDHKSRIAHFKRTMKHIKSADLVILEVSLHSLSMGYLLQKALESSKPVIALHLKDYEPYFATGIENDKLQVLEYTKNDLADVLKYAIDYAADQQDARFNFFISPKHQNYLDWIAKDRKIPRSVYLRNLIERDMSQNKDYSSG
ncbi:MAG: hypothetical protein GF390_00800 [Candidatus Pacebacteria bacterium]|nr:hypothetical protein [Candidatus Paceibacterota bacterium]